MHADDKINAPLIAAMLAEHVGRCDSAAVLIRLAASRQSGTYCGAPSYFGDRSACGTRALPPYAP